MQVAADEGEAEVAETMSDVADLQAELLYVMDELRDNNLAASRSSSNNIQEWKAFLEGAVDAEVVLPTYTRPEKEFHFAYFFT